MSGRPQPIVVTYQGQNMSVSQLSRLVGLSPQLLTYRYKRGKRGDQLTAPRRNAEGT